MAAQYTPITKEEMEAFLLPQGFRPMTLPGTVELVYGKVVDERGWKYTLRVYTGINPSGESREVGMDAIRVEVFWRDREGNVFHLEQPGKKRVHRVKGWKKNLKSRLDKWAVDVKLGGTCPGCGAAPTIQRKARNGGEFMGCVTYSKTKCSGRPKHLKGANPNTELYTPLSQGRGR